MITSSISEKFPSQAARVLASHRLERCRYRVLNKLTSVRESIDGGVDED